MTVLDRCRRIGQAVLSGWLGRLAVCLLLFSLLFWLLYGINHAWIYSCPGDVDLWAYLGIQFNPTVMCTSMAHHPACDLVSLIWPAAVFYKIFPPEIANFLYKLFTFVTACTMMFYLVKSEFGIKTAIWAGLSLAFYKYCLAPFGSDYTDGRVILYLLCTLFFLSAAFAQDATRRREALFLFLGGVFFCCSVSTAVLSIAFAPALAFFSLGKQRMIRGKIEWLRFVYCIAGFLLAFSLWGAWFYVYSGRFFYFASALEKMFRFMGGTRGPQQFDLSRLEWLHLPMLAVVAYPLARLLSTFEDRRSLQCRIGGLAWLTHLIALGTFCFLQYVKNQETLTNDHYLNQILPFTFFTLVSAWIYPAVERLSKVQFAIATSVFFFACLGTFAYATRSRVLDAQWPLAIFCLGAGAALALLFVSKRPAAAAILFFVAMYLSVNSSVTEIIRLNKHVCIGPYVHSREELLDATCRWIRLANQIDPQRDCFLWYNSQEDRAYFRGFSAASHLWQGRILNECSPILDRPIGELGIVNPKHLASHCTGIILIAHDDQEASKAMSNLRIKGIRTECEFSTDFRLNDEKTLRVKLCRLIPEEQETLLQ